MNTFADSFWQHTTLRFNSGGGSMWEPTFKLSRQWFAQNMVDFDLLYIWHGKGTWLDARGKATPVHPGLCFLFRPGAQYEITQSPQTGLGTRYFHFSLFNRAGKPIDPDALVGLPVMHDMSNLKHFDSLTRRINDLIAMSRLLVDRDTVAAIRQNIEVMLKSAVVEYAFSSTVRLSRQFRGVSESGVDLIRGALSNIHQSPAQFNIEDYARHAGCTVDHFRRSFRQVVGQTPHQTLICARIERAKYLLQYTDRTITEIAAEVGYATPFYLSLQFKRMVGVSPSTYRRRNPSTGTPR